MSPGDLLLGTLALAALCAPGWIAARRRQVPQPLLAGFVGGVAGLTVVLLLLNAIGVPLSAPAVGFVWLGLTAVIAWRTRPAAGGPDAPARSDAGRESRLLLLPLAPAVAVVAYRAVAQPLFGIDTVFRWHHLAERILALRTLDFYPPVAAADFTIYGWPDGIAPAVSGIYFWAYALGGGARPLLTAPLVIAQYLLLLLTAGALARRWFSERSAGFARALLACSPLVAWSTAMGQETGLTALALGALLLYLPRNATDATPAAVVFAGLAAGLGALAREYGLLLPLLGLALCLLRRLPRRATLAFIGVAAAVAVPWYARNALRTGNPLYNLDLAGWFPVNEVHTWLMQSYRVEFGWATLPAGAPGQLLANAAAALFGLAAGVMLFPRRGAALLGGALVFAACWGASLGYTAAGFTTSLRVLNPALLVAAVLGGGALARWIPDRRNLGAVTLGLALFATDAALRSLVLPANVHRLPPAAWLAAGNAVHEFHARPIYPELVRVAGRSRLLVLGPDALLASHGARTVPLWSPEVGYVFDARLNPAQIARRLRAADIGFVLLGRGPANERFLARSAFFREPAGTLVPIWNDEDLILLRVREETPP
jgi:hypothetical protein